MWRTRRQDWAKGRAVREKVSGKEEGMLEMVGPGAYWKWRL